MLEYASNRVCVIRHALNLKRYTFILGANTTINNEIKNVFVIFFYKSINILRSNIFNNGPNTVLKAHYFATFELIAILVRMVYISTVIQNAITICSRYN